MIEPPSLQSAVTCVPSMYAWITFGVTNALQTLFTEAAMRMLFSAVNFAFVRFGMHMVQRFERRIVTRCHSKKCLQRQDMGLLCKNSAIGASTSLRPDYNLFHNK